MTSCTLELKSVTKQFKQGSSIINALSNVNMLIQKSEIVALVGPSGSGKTSLLQIAGLLDTPTSGSIFINEINASKSSDFERTEIRKNEIGFIYQFHHLLPEFSALENVAMPLMIKGKGRNLAMKDAKKILEEVGLKERLNHKPHQLSGGEQQRVSIARAIISKPSLILADEPTGNLDSENANIVFEILRNIAKTYQCSCLLVTHNIQLAEKLDKIYFIKDGNIAK